jgi:hypothetical protein
MPATAPPIRVNRAPVLTLWAVVGAERVGYPPDTALTLGRFVAGSSARAKARRLGISDKKQDAEERHARAAELTPRRQTVRLLGRDIPVLAAEDARTRFAGERHAHTRELQGPASENLHRNCRSPDRHCLSKADIQATPSLPNGWIECSRRSRSASHDVRRLA